MQLEQETEDGQYESLRAVLVRYGGSTLRKLCQFHEYTLEFLDSRPESEISVHNKHNPRGVEVYASWDALQAKYGSTSGAWGNTLYRLVFLKLLRRYVPRTEPEFENWNTPEQRRSVERARLTGRDPVSWYHIPEYTPTILAEAEARARELLELKTWNLTKDIIRDHYGTEELQRIYGVSYGEHGQETQRREALELILCAEVERYGYTTLNRVLVTAKARHAAMDEHNHRQHEYWWDNTWKAIYRELFTRYGLAKGQPTREEQSRYGLKSRNHIIRQHSTGEDIEASWAAIRPRLSIAEDENYTMEPI